MKKLFTLLATVTLSVMLFAQAPQSFSYQTVIRDASWQVLSNQNISLEISIIEDVANGTAIYTESHSATTNELGLVNLSIGDGGVMFGSWSNIDWGNHTYFIEVAVDVTGGTSYIVMGTTQLRSVPYALYAETSGSMLPGPQGLQGIQGLPGDTGATGAQGPIGLTGPAGTNGIDGTNGVDGNDGAAGVDGTNGVDGNDGATGAQGPIGLTGPAGTNGIDGTNGVDGNDGAAGVDGTNGVDGNDGAVGAQGPIGLTGPAGPQGATGPQGLTGVQGPQGATGAQGPIGLTGPQGAASTVPGPQGPQGLTGATGPQGIQGIQGPAGVDGQDGVDGAVGATGPQGPQGIQGPAGVDGQDGIDGIDAVVNYDSLANLISVDSTFITTVGGGMGGGCNWQFPDGIGESIHLTGYPPLTYTVPSGKNLYINYANVTNVDLVINNMKVVSISNVNTFKVPIIATDGDVVTLVSNGCCTNGASLLGFLADKIVEPITIDLVNNPYTIPSNKTFVLLNGNGSQNSSFNIYLNGIVTGIIFGNETPVEEQKSIPIIFKSGDILADQGPGTSTGTHILNGYLADENYFANCGGGGGSSSSNSNTTIDSLSQVVSNLDSLMGIITPFFGCTDPTACNYDSNAVIDNGSCTGLLGCTDNQSSNYNASATCDNGTCIPYVGMYGLGGVVYHIDNYNAYSVARIININHEDVIGTHMNSMYATAAAVTTNGYTDWQAPTLAYIQNICSSQSIINLVANMNGGLPLVNDYYLTSDQWCTVSNQPKAEPYYISNSSSCNYSSPPGGCPGSTYRLRTVRNHTF